MKKIVIVICFIFLILISILLYKYFDSKNYISSDIAKEIAMKDVSNKDGNYTFNSVTYTNENDKYIYILEFSDNNNLYTYKIDAKNKKIIYSNRQSLTNNKEYMMEDDILEIVFKHANLNKNDCNLISNLVILEDNIPIYNTVFYYNNIRYEYKTNALTGSII